MYLLVIFLYISGMKNFIAIFIMLLTVGNMSGFSKIISDLSENSNEIVLISDYDQVIADVIVIDFEMIMLELRVNSILNSNQISKLYINSITEKSIVIPDKFDKKIKNKIKSNLNIKNSSKSYRINYHKARDKLRT